MYTIRPTYSLDPEEVYEYWNVLEEADLIKYRLADMAEPKVQDAINMVKMFLDSTYMVRDNEGKLICEFTLMNFSGHAAQIHFSMHPSNTMRTNIDIGKMCTDAPIYTWERADKPGIPYLTSIYGLTPLQNRPACLLVLKTGMKKMFVLPNGTRYLGEPCDGMVTMKTKQLPM